MATMLLSFSGVADDRAAIAAGLRRRDPDLLDALIEQYQYRLFRYLLYLSGSRETAEDLFQETWVRVLDRGGQYDGKAKFETWLFAIARHLTIDLQRRKKPQSLDSIVEPEVEGMQPAALDRVSIHECLDRLPSVYREVLMLRFQEDLTLEEIAGILEAPLSTVKARLYRGLDAMRREFGEAKHAG
jgi:RNA polymerase sigma-70 factor (ECF subfamily)